MAVIEAAAAGDPHLVFRVAGHVFPTQTRPRVDLKFASKAIATIMFAFAGLRRCDVGCDSYGDGRFSDGSRRSNEDNEHAWILGGDCHLRFDIQLPLRGDWHRNPVWNDYASTF